MISKTHLSNITENFPGLVALYNIKTGQYIYVNKTLKSILGYEPKDFIKGGMRFVSSLVHPKDLPRILKENAQAIKSLKKKSKGKVQNKIEFFEYRMKHKDGTWRWLYTEGCVFSYDKKGNPELILNTSLDITGLKDKEENINSLNKELKKLRESEKGFRSFIEAVEDYAIIRLDEKGNIASWNEGVKCIFGYEEKEILNQPLSILFSPADQKKRKHEKELEIARAKGSYTEDGLRMKKDGTIFFASITTTPIWGKQHRLKGYSKIVRDITEKREAEETIKFHAYHDVLTGLINRKALDEYFERLTSKNKKPTLAILFLDLDRFKNINDTLGHGIGDFILKEVATRLTNCIRSGDAIARLGGDEFIVILNNIHKTEEVVAVANKILDSFTPLIQVQNHSLHLSTSIGIAMYPTDGQDIYTLLKNADTALYRAKDTGRNRFQFYDVSMNLHAYANLALENDLRQAVSKDEIIYHYQPIVDKNKKLIGTEALMRWEHPTLGLLQPGQFIGLAEETGLITPIGNAGNKKVWSQYKVWKDDFDFCCRISLNISTRQFSEIDFIEKIKNILKQLDLLPTDIELEITESIAMNNTEITNIKMGELRDMGVALSIDDFGTGYSSLSYLKTFPINRLKIDKSFVRHCITDKQDRSIIKAIIAMGHSLEVEVIAEGVETEDQFKYLVEEGCDGFQGYLFDKPISADRYSKWVNQ